MLTEAQELGRRRGLLFLIAGVLLVALGTLDHLTGPELGFSIFYLLPVSLVAWLAGKRAAVLFALGASGAWLVADLTSGATYSHSLVPFWNSVVRLGFFLIVVYLIAALRRSYEASTVRGRSLEAMNEVARAVLEEQGADEVLDLIANQARELSHAAFASVVVPEDDGNMLVRAAAGEGADGQRGKRFPAKGSITEEVINSRQPILVPDASADARINQPIVRAGNIGPALFAPLGAGRRVFGSLAVANLKGSAGFTQQDMTIVNGFAAEAAIALEYAEIHRDLERLAVVGDRERIAQELHDGVVQSLFAVGMTIQAACVADDPSILRGRLEHVLDEIDRVIRDVRSYIFELRPRLLTHQELERAFRDLVQSFGQPGRVEVEMMIEPETASRLGARAGHLLQAAREALSNAIRHSNGDRLAVNISQADGMLILEVSDNGRGFEPERDLGKGLGLSNLRARADALGGRLEIDTAAGQGSRVSLLVPL